MSAARKAKARPPVLRIHNDEMIVDSFAGGGGASVGIGWALGRDPDIAINHNAEAIAMHQANHPKTKHYVCDVFEVDPLEACGLKAPWSEIQTRMGRFKVGCMWLSPDCFPAGTMILARDGYRPIEEIAVGDEVLTHEQRWRKVTATMRTTKPLVRLRGHGHPGLLVSPEHPFYARRRNDVWRTEPRGYERKLEPADWVAAGDLEPGWYWASPAAFPEEHVPPVPVYKQRETTISAGLMWLAGRYIADGWTRLSEDRAELVLTCGRHEVAELRRELGQRCPDFSWYERETATAHQFSTSHRGFIEWLREHFGHGAAEKKLPGWALGMKDGLRRALLAGYLSGDGCVSRGDGSPLTVATTVSKALAFGLKALVQGIGYAGVTVALRTTQPDVIEGRKVNVRPAWRVCWRANIVEGHGQTVGDGGMVWAAVRERVDDVCPAAEVFNLSVEEDESYVADGIVVHNCTFHSKARGAKPFRDRNKARRRRGLAGVALKWMTQVRPRFVALENVEEFEDWGPLNDDGSINELLRGFNFRRFVQRIRNLGYDVEWRQMRACDFGAPTSRNRLYMLMRCDGKPIAWPEPTHGDAPGLQPFRTAAECIDWSIACPSIFMSRADAAKFKKQTGIEVRRPLSAKTMRRIAAGVWRYVLKSDKPFLVPTPTGTDAPALIQTSWGERKGQKPRVLNIHEPLGTIMAGGIKHSVVQARLERVAAFVAKHYGGEHPDGEPKSPGQDAREPLGTVTTSDHNYVITAHLMNMKGAMTDRQSSSQPVDQPAPTICAGGNHAALVYAFMVKYYGTDQDPRLDEPMHTLTTKDRMALVTVTIVGEQYAIVDIGMRMLTPRELFRAMGFPADYVIDPVVEREVKRGKKTVRVRGKLGKKGQVHMCGNAVAPPAAEALLVPNFAVHEEEERSAIA